MPNPESSHQGGSSSNRSRDDVRYNAYHAINSWSNAMDIDDRSNQHYDISRLVARLPEEDYDDIVTEPDRLEASSSDPGGSSSRHRHGGRTSSRRNASGSSGGGHSSESGRSSRSGSSGGAGQPSRARRSSSGSRDRGVSSNTGASREAEASTQNIWRCNICHRNYRSRVTLRDHTRKFHEGPYRCRVGCQQEFTNAGNRYRHEVTVHTARENAPWRCAICNCSFRNEKDLKHHYRSGHPNNS